MHISTSASYASPRSSRRRILIAILWILGLFLGMFCAVYAGDSLSSLMLGLPELPMSIVGLLCGMLMPFLLIAFALAFQLPWLLYMISFGKSFAFGFCALLMAVLLFGNVRFSNGLYLKKDLEHDAYMAVVNRIVYRMEDFDGYVPGETPVAIVGLPQQMADIVPGFETYRDPNGMWMSDVLCFPEPDRWAYYFKYTMMNPIKLAGGDIWHSMPDNPQVAQMPVYPAEGSLALIDDVLVVKLS